MPSRAHYPFLRDCKYCVTCCPPCEKNPNRPIAKTRSVAAFFRTYSAEKPTSYRGNLPHHRISMVTLGYYIIVFTPCQLFF